MTLENAIATNRNLYLGNLSPRDPQFHRGNFIGLALRRESSLDLECNLRFGIPFPSNSVEKIQAEDVLEHIPFEECINLLDEIYRVLKKGNGIFRLSVPDYQSRLLSARSVYDSDGNILGDLMTSTKVFYDAKSEKLIVEKSLDGESHQWFPTNEVIRNLIKASNISKCREIRFHHYYETPESFIMNEFEENEMPVSRMPPHDMRADGAPISLIIDFLK